MDAILLHQLAVLLRALAAHLGRGSINARSVWARGSEKSFMLKVVKLFIHVGASIDWTLT